ncbi:VWA domain-containing protein [Microcoleus sp. PH2017_05_CCC_O_A]|uniref:VWA domain-containing protein n=1 Tax=Microcoleus sp. PH2017_05_CCC_O_A TaxID=2798816 RepID=UPI001D950B3A|nr:VWA domain-containing protein [Microcoleus sp. PH2017_05_CCC_O_A]MCC3439064.1 VWA domain-containing protein [Microcoleus sp. PH2017_05_CCC_O_A]
MRKLLLQIVVLSPVILTFCWMNPKSAIALEVDRQTNAPTPTNVSQSADIAPSSWAFQALLSLAKRYSCPIVAPVGTTLGDRPLKRSEFAVSLNSCLVNVDRAIAAGTPKVGPEDLAIVQRLQTEFAPELATLRGRVDALEARSGELEQNRNPPLSEPNSVPLPAPSPQTAPQRVRLNLDSRTSGNLIGQDTLRTRNFGGINQPVTPLPSPTTTALPAQTQQFDREGYNRIYDNSYQRASNNPLSTFGIDVDTASYSNVRRFINSGVMPPKDAVRLEELINYFTYDYPQPKGDRPFSINTEVANAPWNPQHKLVHIGLQGKSISTKNLPPNNLVFLIDVSGSMNSPDKLPLVKASLKYLVSELRAKDSVTIVVYAGAAGLVLPPTPGNQKEKILDSIDKLEAGGSTAGGAGIQLAYKVAKDNFIKQGNNRVILATDGDFNVGVSSDGELVRMIEEKREQGVFLSVLGFGTGNLQDAKMEQLADKGNGNYAYIDSLLEAKKVLVTQMGGTLFTIAKDVKIQVEFNPAKVQAYRLVGYENRVLQNQDFNDDKKDAGELGAGHSVTAIYEIIPVGVASDVKLPEVDPLKYQPNPATASTSQTDELMQVKLRYKNPNETVSQLITQSQAKGEDKEGYRAEFIRLVENCKTLVAKIGVK